MRRIGTKFGGAKQRGRRQVVWFFVCPVCKSEKDSLARRKPTFDPDEEIFSPRCNHGVPEYPETEMENQGLFFLTMKDGKKMREPASDLREKWEAMRVQYLRGRICECDHAWWEHKIEITGGRIIDTTPHECKKCHCQGFKWKKTEGYMRNSPDDPEGKEVPF